MRIHFTNTTAIREILIQNLIRHHPDTKWEWVGEQMKLIIVTVRMNFVWQPIREKVLMHTKIVKLSNQVFIENLEPKLEPSEINLTNCMKHYLIFM